MKVIRVINVSNRSITINNTTVQPHKVKDFPLDLLSKDDLEDIASYSAVGVVKSFEFDIPDKITPSVEIDTVLNEEVANTPKRNRKK